MPPKKASAALAKSAGTRKAAKPTKSAGPPVLKEKAASVNEDKPATHETKVCYMLVRQFTDDISRESVNQPKTKTTKQTHNPQRRQRTLLKL